MPFLQNYGIAVNGVYEKEYVSANICLSIVFSRGFPCTAFEFPYKIFRT